MLRDSDSAMFHAKTLGGARWVVFDQEMHSTALARLQLEHDLRRAVEMKEFLVFYQPILDLATGGVAGFEALVRWQHPQRGLLAPRDFLAVAAEIGLGAEIDRYVVRRACLQTREWLNELGPLPEIVVNANLRGMTLMQPGLVEYLEATLCETGLNAHRLRLELTEADLLETTPELQTVLNRLCELKVELCLDDFGTGYSSLSYLERFPVTHLKIDRSFIAKACDNGKHLAIVQTIVALAQNLGMQVTAEGVENDHQLELVRGLKCEYAQGYRISVPLDGQAAGEWLRHRRGESVGPLGRAKTPRLA
jgi:EAL domain-containing protein (putative c-di-GMP-specific phosphodiesterase class I)